MKAHLAIRALATLSKLRTTKKKRMESLEYGACEIDAREELPLALGTRCGLTGKPRGLRRVVRPRDFPPLEAAK